MSEVQGWSKRGNDGKRRSGRKGEMADMAEITEMVEKEK